MIATQDYGWSQLARRDGHGWPEGTDWAMRQAAAAGLTGWEPFLNGPDDADRIGALAQVHGLAMPSVFLSGPLHEPADATLDSMVQTAIHAARFGARLVAVYPTNLGAQRKTDAQLVTQVDNLLRLAVALRSLGLKVLYHPEEPEMANAACEFHHMLAGTDPGLIRLCLDPDTHWRGGGGSMLAVLDVIELYGDRIDAVHIRQSRQGVWAETVGAGDLDYAAVAQRLADKGARPLLVLEHAYADETAITMDVVAAHRASVAHVTDLFGPR